MITFPSRGRERIPDVFNFYFGKSLRASSLHVFYFLIFGRSAAAHDFHTFRLPSWRAKRRMSTKLQM